MVNEVSCNPRRASLGRTGFVTNKAGTQQTIWLPPYCFFKTEEKYCAAAHAAPKKMLTQTSPGFYVSVVQVF